MAGTRVPGQCQDRRRKKSLHGCRSLGHVAVGSPRRSTASRFETNVTRSVDDNDQVGNPWTLRRESDLSRELRWLQHG